MKRIRAGQKIIGEGKRTKTGSVKQDEMHKVTNFKIKQEIKL